MRNGGERRVFLRVDEFSRYAPFGRSFDALSTHLFDALNCRFGYTVKWGAFGRASRGTWNKCDGVVVVAFMPRKPLDALEDADA